MQVKTIVNLIYTAKGQKESGSPIELEHKICNIKCDLMETFSQNYYASNQRIMRLSKNIAVNVKLTEDIFIDNNRYELMYVEHKGLKYRVQNILNHRHSTLLKILDIQELR